MPALGEIPALHRFVFIRTMVASYEEAEGSGGAGRPADGVADDWRARLRNDTRLLQARAGSLPPFAFYSHRFLEVFRPLILTLAAREGEARAATVEYLAFAPHGFPERGKTILTLDFSPPGRKAAFYDLAPASSETSTSSVDLEAEAAARRTASHVAGYGKLSVKTLLPKEACRMAGVSPLDLKAEAAPQCKRREEGMQEAITWGTGR
ncbi:hypothetical protein cyc_01211 [Cyclospora cayetanensis]|uniref:Uncharacterized protein n=1 Tax=Cyclospora cayetanensis TaxID=88456 RepID=A0A1D3CXP2_9EIME|nr:hypothetical protein cyc_01211 [Cyclospora cayetanensis]